MKIAIIGAGLAGLTCADRLREQGHEPVLFDKGRGPGGRMSTRRVHTTLGEASFDHGTPWFVVRDLRFRRAVLGWEAAGLAGRWDAPGEEAWVGVPAMNSVVKHCAARHEVRFGCMIRGLGRCREGWRLIGETAAAEPFEAVILAVPMEQAMAMVALHDLPLARLGSRVRAEPCWAGLFAFAERLRLPFDALRHAGIFCRIARNSAKPGRTGPESWVVQADAGWSAARIESEPTEIAAELQEEFARIAGFALPTPLVAQAHRWRFATYAGTSEEALWNDGLKLGICGDWLLGGDVESAWLSGRAMAEQLQIAAVQQNAFPSRTAG